MLTLLIAFLAGIGTALSPCALPVLPVLLSTAATGGHRRPLGVITGLALTFTAVIAGLGALLVSLGLPDATLKYLGAAVLLVLGVSLLLPGLRERIETPLYRLTRFAPKQGGTGFLSGLPVGGALAFLYAPCAGPVLAAVVTASAQGNSVIQVLPVAAAYSLGTALAMLGIMLVGRRFTQRVRTRSGVLQRVMGALLIGLALIFATDLDSRFQQAIATSLPAFIVNPTGELERSALQGEAKFQSAGSGLERLGRAPEFTGITAWRNTPGNRALTREGLRGKVYAIDFWTYSCINCIRNTPHLQALSRQYRAQGFTLIGVHSPEFAFERSQGNIDKAIKRLGITYPVASDPELSTWSGWGNQFWPALYLVDAEGEVRYTHFGEGNQEETENAVRALLREAGQQPGGKIGTRAAPSSPGLNEQLTPETYTGLARREGFLNGRGAGERDYSLILPRRVGSFSFGGRWSADPEKAIAGERAQLAGRVRAQNVYLVISPPPGSSEARARLTLRGAQGGADVRGGVIRLDEQRLYHLAQASRVGEISFRLTLPEGAQAFAFTFG